MSASKVGKRASPVEWLDGTRVAAVAASQRTRARLATDPGLSNQTTAAVSLHLILLLLLLLLLGPL